MFVIFNKDGSIFAKTQSDYVMQGSNRVNKVFVGFVDNDYADWTCNGVFNLPNGTRWTIPAIYVAGGFQYLGTTYFGWQIELTDDITKYFGNVELSIQIVNSQTSILYTYLTNITVNRTGFPIDGSWDASINVAQLNDYMAQLATKLQANTVSVAIRESDLPSTGEKNVLYFVIGATSNEPYQVKMWNGSEYTLLGTVNLSTYANQEDISQLRNEIANPFTVVDTIGDLPSTDQNRLYIVVATGKWYYWNGTEYAEGGQFININEASNLENGQGKNSIQQKGNYASGDNSFAIGVGSDAYGEGSFASGIHTFAVSPGQAVFGKYNKGSDYTIFEIGNGTEWEQSNAFEVYKDGHAEVQKVGTTDNSVITKGYVDPQILEIKNALYGTILAVENQNYVNVGWGIFDRANGYPIVNNQKAQITSVKGRTLVKNQLQKISTQPTYTDTDTGLTITNNNDGTITISGTILATKAGSISITKGADLATYNNRVYLTNLHNSSPYLSFRIAGQNNATFDAGVSSKIWTATADRPNNSTLYMAVVGGVGETIDITIRPQTIDFTKMFGAGREPTTVAEFNNLTHNWFFNTFDEGTINPTNFFQINKKGFNKFDGVLESGEIFGSGALAAKANAIRTKNYIQVLGGTNYTLYLGNFTNYTNVYWHAYDKNQNSISRFGGSGFREGNIYSMTTPVNAAYIKIFFVNNNVSSIDFPTNPQICFHLTGDGSMNGVYKPYNADTVDVFDLDNIPTLQGVGTAQDEKTLTQDITRIDNVDLGTLNWTYQGDGLFNATTPIDAVGTNTATPANLLCVKYISGSYYAVTNKSVDKQITFNKNNKLLYIMDRDYTDGTTFKQSLSGQKLYFERSTPIILRKYYTAKVDLGSLNFGGSNGKFYASVSSITEAIKIPTSADGVANILCSLYTTVSGYNASQGTTNLTIGININGYLYIRDDSCNTTTELLAKINGIPLYYETTEIVSTPLPEIGLGEIIIDNVERLGTFNINAECIADFEIASVVYKPIGE